jgi:hypothetical protein
LSSKRLPESSAKNPANKASLWIVDRGVLVVKVINCGRLINWILSIIPLINGPGCLNAQSLVLIRDPAAFPQEG